MLQGGNVEYFTKCKGTIIIQGEFLPRMTNWVSLIAHVVDKDVLIQT